MSSHLSMQDVSKQDMSKQDLQAELAAAKETIGALRRRMAKLESGGKTPFVKQLSIYQQRIEDELVRLKISQDWSKALVENTMDGIVGLDEQGAITSWNPRAVSMFGWSQHEAKGYNLLSLLGLTHGQQEAKPAQSFAERFGMSAGQSFELLAKNKAGESFSVECVMLAMAMPGCGAYVVLFRDISDRKRAEAILKQSNAELERLVRQRTQEIQRSEERFSLAMRGANDGLWDWDLSSNQVYYSPRWKQMLGYQAHEMGETIDVWKQLLHAADKDAVLRQMQDYIMGKSLAFNMEFRMVHQSGQVVDVLSRAFLVFAEDKKTPIRLVGTNMDISERKRVEHEMFRLATIVESTSDFVGIAKITTGEMIYLNRAAREKFGILPDADVRDYNIADFHSAEEAQRIMQVLLPQTISDNALESELNLRHFDGSDMPTSSVVMSFGDSADAPKYIALVARDLSREKELQKQVEHVDRLESIGVLAGGIAHDFNNILGGIRGNAELLQRYVSMDERAAAHVQRIKDGSDRAADLCCQMLAYAGKGKMISAPVNLNAIIEDMLTLLNVSLHKSVQLHLHLAPSLPDVLADVAQIRQVLMNLVINASESMHSEFKVITVTTRVGFCAANAADIIVAQADMQQNPYVYMTVRDTGCGMDEAVKRQLFDPFFTTKFTGRGLGMSAVLGIINGHHGVLALHSEVGMGSTFHIGFPANESVQPLVNTIEEIGQNAGQEVELEPVVLGTVLVIDDEVMIREIQDAMLVDMGYAVLEAVDGQDGVAQYVAHADIIDMVIIDLTMPVMDGRACFTALKKLNPKLNIIITSGYSEEDVLAMFKGQSLRFIKKPFTVEQFQKVVRESQAAQEAD